MSGALLTDLQKDIAGYMLQCANLDHLNIVVDDQGAIDAMAQKAVSTIKSRGHTKGIAALILRPVVASANANLPGPQSDAIVTIQMSENVSVNRGSIGSKILPDDMSFRILDVLHHLQIGSKTLFAAPTPIQPLPAPVGFVSYEIILRIPLHNQPLEKTRQPVIDNDGGTVTLTSATPSAAFNYSLDGSYPSLVYTAPFAVSSGELVRAIATSASLLPSGITELTIS